MGTLKNKTNPAGLFLWFALVFGLMMTFITPPFQSPDEPAHFFRAYQVSDLGFVPVNQGNTAGGYLPSSLVKTFFLFRFNSKEHDMKEISGLMNEALNMPLDKHNKEYTMFPNMALYAPVLYFPQAIGIAIGKPFNLPPVLLLYLARVFNLLFWVLLMYKAISWMPFNKWLIAALSITPMAVHLAGSANSDALVMAFSFLFLSYVLKIAFEPQAILNWKTLLILTFLSVLVAFSKNIYVLMSALVFLIPVSKANGLKDYLLKLCTFFGVTAMVAALMYFFVQGVLDKVDVIELYYGGSPFPLINPDKQIAFIFSDIPRFLSVVLFSFFDAVEMAVKSWIGILGWLQIFFPEYYYLGAFLVLMGFAIFGDQKKYVASLWGRLLFLGTFVSILLAFSFTMYCSWNEPGDPRITNLQGRYFIPVAPLALMLFQNRKLTFPPQVSSLIFIAFAAASMFLTVRMQLLYYYF